MSSLAGFAERINVIAASVEKRAPLIVRKVAGTCLQTVVMATPVGNPSIWKDASPSHGARPGYVGGRARANWLVGVGGRRSETTDRTDASGSNTINEGTAKLNEAVADSVVHLSNNLPYIVPLNEGHSHQAPVGFVERAVQAAIAAVKTNTIKLTEG